MKKIVLNILLIGLSIHAFAYIKLTDSNVQTQDEHGSEGSDDRAAGCTAPNDYIYLNYNNVKARIETGGLMWQNRADGNSDYFVPENSDAAVIYSGALWMGGTDVNGQLKLAAQKFGQGRDFWAGPLSANGGSQGNYDPSVQQSADVNMIRPYGDAEIIPEQCSEYDNFFTIRKTEVQQFITWWNCENGLLPTEECEDVTSPDDEVLQRIIDWPAHGDTDLGQDKYLAPFYDNPNAPSGLNGEYNPLIDGDYPWYDLEDDVDCRNDRRVTLFGDETNWWVFNDKGNIHTETGGDPIGMEIRAQAFAFATNDQINDMTFYNYELINREHKRYMTPILLNMWIQILEEL